jgi:hypothetical protein
MSKLNPHEVALAGERLVIAELERRGAMPDVVSAGNRRRVEATDAAQTRTVTLRVKTASDGQRWQGSTTDGQRREESSEEDHFWVFVGLAAQPRFYVVPQWWMENEIYEGHQGYLAEHGGSRPGNPDSTHTLIDLSRIEQWYDRWDLLGVFDKGVGEDG